MKVQSQNANDTLPRARAVRVNVDTLTVGAKIVGLDRPWSESGVAGLSFTIAGVAELAELRKKHTFVFIEAVPESAPKRASAQKAVGRAGSDQPIVVWDDSSNDTEEDEESSPLMRKLHRAKQLFSFRKQSSESR